jgi:hypothetical protein
VPTVVITLAPAAPMRVPAAPKTEPRTAVVTAARAAAATWVRLRSILRGGSSGLGGECGAVMISWMSMGLVSDQRADAGFDAGYVNHGTRLCPIGGTTADSTPQVLPLDVDREEHL